MDVVVTVRPTVEPVTLAEAKAHLRVDHDAEDTLIEALISAARAAVEHRTGRAIAAQTVSLRLPEFPDGDVIWLPRPVTRSVSSVKYYDSANVIQTMTATTDYLTYASENEGSVYLPSGAAWPVAYDRPDAVTVLYLAGWATSAEVPEELKRAILLLVGSLYENRMTNVVGTIVNDIPNHIDALLDPWRVWSLN